MHEKNDISQTKGLLYQILQVGNLESLAKWKQIGSTCRVNLKVSRCLIHTHSHTHTHTHTHKVSIVIIPHAHAQGVDKGMHLATSKSLVLYVC